MRKPRTIPRLPQQQRGIALAVALIMLVILTIIGVSSMNTTNLQEKMATSMQELYQAFTAAESAVTKAVNNASSLNVNQAVNSATSSYGHAQAKTTTEFIGWNVPKRGTGYSAVKFRAANFDISATAVAGNRTRTEIHQGIFQIVNKPNQ